MPYKKGRNLTGAARWAREITNIILGVGGIAVILFMSYALRSFVKLGGGG
jgi:hypothetical protein